ncbi:uncharacterized protein LOC132174259 [Corylus avellana]|uniref:uncharacterized protein LOC132174259 n=1 Tax=Corylus avellana TaxID=13451 RepID=UPI00286BED84|nr:uncharacterized protein LOC132174259 [Corylus avellana]
MVPNWLGATVGKNKDNELVLTRVQKGWQGSIDYRELNATTRKDHFSPLFIDRMLERLVGYPYYCVLDGYSSHNRVLLDHKDQEKPIFICSFGAFAYCHKLFGSCDGPAVESLAEDEQVFSIQVWGTFSNVIERKLRFEGGNLQRNCEPLCFASKGNCGLNIEDVKELKKSTSGVGIESTTLVLEPSSLTLEHGQ